MILRRSSQIAEDAALVIGGESECEPLATGTVEMSAVIAVPATATEVEATLLDGGGGGGGGGGKNLVKKLRELEDAKNDGLVSQEEYDVSRVYYCSRVLYSQPHSTIHYPPLPPERAYRVAHRSRQHQRHAPLHHC